MDSLEPLMLTEDSFEESGGGNIEIAGHIHQGKTVLMAHLDRLFKEYYGYEKSVGNLTLYGELGKNHTILKGNDLRNWLLECTHIPYRNMLVNIDEIDSLAPARASNNSWQTEIAIRLWHSEKLRNWVLYTDHRLPPEEEFDHSTDLIIQKAANFVLWPQAVNWFTDSLDVIVENRNTGDTYTFTAHHITSTMRLYSRHEGTENESEDIGRIEQVREKMLKRYPNAKDKHDKIVNQMVNEAVLPSGNLKIRNAIIENKQRKIADKYLKT